ncbi:sulfate reduction electron transfer complex DsrMKJOP subunit DsrJ [Desulfobacterales bacterium HSG17]|nr:sulfate reduction electron transfer complex DsrMKJOP subunit DsrJ [Desulfobacterales bacterium HSG17]
MPNNKSTMYDSTKIIVGLIIFVIIATIPFWFNMLKAAPKPVLELSAKAKAAKECVMPTDYMTAEHMQLLDVWRDTVVRDSQRTFVSPNGHEYEMSLSNTCLDCHANKAEFCDRCHTYASVEPFCWDCHIQDPKEES